MTYKQAEGEKGIKREGEARKSRSKRDGEREIERDQERGEARKREKESGRK